MFSAVALVAFSFAGMANTGGEEKLESKTLTKIENSDCDGCWAYADSLDDGKDRTNQKWMKNVDSCLVANGCEPQHTHLIKDIN